MISLFEISQSEINENIAFLINGNFIKGIFERAFLNWHYRKDILMKDISERAFPKGHFDEGHFEGRAFPKGERAKGMKGIVHKLEFIHHSYIELFPLSPVTRPFFVPSSDSSLSY